ncbi:unnamed protein product [Rotaria magnacalcarata]|uniref:Uncharacterized protein n=2 Tax=Rotaria magnacalcarata TaxID=392030 RepID=A0A820ITB1_9BILA|nr:unnamed protein product [Rotaria magnacalcarata]CAF3823896.1 unnamed protein product [Rotaria magnacalcarata]CAF4127574.1 unnamed protein product [Rotaria magnacalcarata]CAF4234870.1 unnamed protein product [Rotaria magnacalcarata]CAF4314273.1 unnamed protein product [Rotaria magnacalcarata]
MGISPDNIIPEVLYRDTDDDIQMSEFALQKNIPLGLADLGLLATLNQLINYLDPRPEYIRVIIIEWSIKSSISIARTVSLDTQRSLISARRCKDLDGYSQQVD